MDKGDSCEAMQKILHNGDDNHDSGIDEVIELLGNWFSNTELNEFLTFIESEKYDA